LEERITTPVIGSSAASGGMWWRARIFETVRAGTPVCCAIHSRPRQEDSRRPTTSASISAFVALGQRWGRLERSTMPISPCWS